MFSLFNCLLKVHFLFNYLYTAVWTFMDTELAASAGGRVDVGFPLVLDDDGTVSGIYLVTYS